MNAEQAIAKLKQFKREIPVIVGNEMVNHAQDNILAGSYDGVPMLPRKSSAPRNEGRGLLRDTGDGMRSITFVIQRPYVGLVANDYMVAHNEGAHITGSASVSSHSRRRAGRTHRVRAHTRQMDTVLPQRQFTGDSKVLKKRIVTALLTRFKRL